MVGVEVVTLRGGIAVLAFSLVTVAFVAPVASGQSTETLLEVDDGAFFYDTDGDCVGDTNDHTDGEALRHWHVGVPFAPAMLEVAGGFGCGPHEAWAPQTWTVTVDEGHEATVTGEVSYLWDQNVPGGGFNDVQIHITDEQGLPVYSTFEQDGPNPVDPVSPAIESHTVDTTLDPGTYTIHEDIFSGEHTTWLTQLTVTQQPSDGTGGGY